MNNFLDLLGKLHIVLVHFPISLIFLAGLTEFVSVLRRKDSSSSISILFLSLGFVFSIVAACLGWLNANYLEFYGENESLLFYHRWLGVIFVVFCFLSFFLGLSKYRKYYAFERFFRFFRPTLFVTCILLGATSHFGGSLVYGSNYFFEDFVTSEESSKDNLDPLVKPLANKDATQPLSSSLRGIKNFNVSFARDIQPIFKKSCYKCHGNGKSKGKFSLHTKEDFLKGGKSGQAITPGDSKGSSLIKLVKGEDPDNIMPEKGDRLTVGEIELLSLWIDQAKSFEALNWDVKEDKAKIKIAPLALSKIEIPNDEKSGLNYLLSEYFKSKKLKEPEFLKSRMLLKKAYLDTIGKFPSFKETEAFEATKRKYENLVNSLLSKSKLYSVNWLPFWNDLLRNDYSGPGFLKGGRQEITDWLFQSLLENKPYNKMVQELVAPSKSSRGFIKGLVWQGDVNPNELPEMQAAQNTAQVFLGVNLKCASCHDSFIDNWKLNDAYGLANVFSKNPLETHECEIPAGEFVEAKFLFPELGGFNKSDKRIDRLKNLAILFTKKENGRFARTIVNRLWEKLLGRGLIYDVDSLDKNAWSVEILDYLSGVLIKNNYDLKIIIKEIMTSNAYKYKPFDYDNIESEEFLFKGPVVRRISFEQYVDNLEAFSNTWLKLSANDITRAERLIKNKKRASNLNEQFVPGDKKLLSFEVIDAKKLLIAVSRRKNLNKAPLLLTISNLKILNTQGVEISLKDLNLSKNQQYVIHPKENLIDKSKLPELIHNDSLRMFPFSAIELELPKNDNYQLSFNVEANEIIGLFPKPIDDRDKRLKKNKKQNLSRLMILSNVEVPAAFREMNDLFSALGRPERAQVTTRRNNIDNAMKALRVQTSKEVNSLFLKTAPSSEKCDIFIDGSRLYMKLLQREPTEEEKTIFKKLLEGKNSCRNAYIDLAWIIINSPEFQLI